MVVFKVETFIEQQIASLKGIFRTHTWKIILVAIVIVVLQRALF